MNAEYDEDLTENHFLQELKNKHESTLERVIQEGWIVCVPRNGSFVARELQNDEVNAHILIPRRDLVARFDSLSGNEILLADKVLTEVRDDAEQISSRLLFEEIFYSRDMRKYCVWCVERPLKATMYISNNSLSLITNLQEAVNFLQVEVANTQLRNDLDNKIKEFLYVNKSLDCKFAQMQADLVRELYTDCLKMLLEDAALREKISEDACLNKIIRNLDEIELNDLRVRSDLQSRVYGGKIELSRLDCFVTVLGKIECLRRTVNYISRGTSSVSSDDLLPVLVFLVVKAGLSNWTAQLLFMKQFRLSTDSAHEADEAGFLITSLEAAMEHIKSGTICRDDNQQTEQSERSSVSYLFSCIKNGNLSEVERLLTHKESSYVDHISFCHPLCSCASCERNWTKQRDLNAHPKDERGLTPLHVAVLYDQIVIVDFLLDRETDINAADSDGLTALHYACVKGHQNILLLMLHANADPTLTDSRGNTPLHLAVDRGHENCVKALLYLSEHMRMPVDANTANENGDTPLHLAARWGYGAIVRILLEYCANRKIINKKGQTPLAVTYNESIADLLRSDSTGLSTRANFAHSQPLVFQQCHWPTSENKTLSHPKNYAKTMQHRMMDKLLAAIVDGDICLACYYLGLEVYRERPSNTRASLCHHPLCDCERCSAIGECKLERTRRQRTLAINACNSIGETALHVASATGRTRMVQLLLDAGANVNVVTESEGRTPLHLACLHDHIDVAKLLLNCATCDVDAKDGNCDTPLHLATMAGNVKIVGLLVRCGANTVARNLQNKTPLRQVEEKLSIVFSSNHANILKILKQNSTQPAGD
ncbi:ankyrin repeat domain-containing protein 27-like isoform X2 [Pseudomyrmex gracilis]|uniref:ankyrin repeat domain-containing protein 27-like isoform X2 n=1 Tax=Pseudomyrmex gracilis TaxID=219809 RepID=UPI000995B040|nr:ankyrin repeat domain-containing protein 27-like isoform X2 [Pseudomyrmex gracilis]